MDANQNSPDVLCAEILADAQRQSDDILRRAKGEAESILAAATTEAEKIRRERREQAQAKAAHRKELILATVAVEANLQRAARIEALLESIHDAIRRHSTAGDFNAPASVRALAVQAGRQMPGHDLIVKISPKNHAAFGQALPGEIRRQLAGSLVNFTISADASVGDGGVAVQSGDGFQFWDNRLTSRLERLWPELRRQIALRTGLVVENNSAAGKA